MTENPFAFLRGAAAGRPRTLRISRAGVQVQAAVTVI